MRLTIKRFSCFLLLMLGSVTQGFALDLGSSEDANFEIVGDRSSIYDGVVTTLAQDALGFIWIGTANGLIRFDGYQFRRYAFDPADPHTIGGNFIRALLVASDGKLWIGTDADGVSVLDPATGHFKNFNNNPDDSGSLQSGSIRSLAEGLDKEIWLGSTGGGLSRFQKDTEKFLRFDKHSDASGAPNDSRISSLHVDARGDLWVGTWNGLDRLRRGSNTFETVYSDAESTESLSGKSIRTTFSSKDGSLWVGTNDGEVIVIDPEAGTGSNIVLSRQMVGGTILAISQPSADRIWVGHTSGIDVFDRNGMKLIKKFRNDPTNPDSVTASEIRAFLIDRAGGLWVGSFGGGVQRVSMNNDGFRVVRQERDASNAVNVLSVTSVLESSNGQIWLGTAANGVSILDASLKLVKTLHQNVDGTSMSDDMVTGLAQTSNGTVWVGTERNLFRYVNSRLGLQRDNASDGLQGAAVRRLLAGRQGELWIGSTDGLFVLESNAIAISRLADIRNKPVTGSVNAIAETADGGMWIGANSGLYYRANDSRELIPVEFEKGYALSHVSVVGLLVDSKQGLWVDTPHGLHHMLRWNGKQAAFESISAKHRIAGGPYGANLLEDTKGRIWTHKFVYDPGQNLVYELNRADGIFFGTGWFRSYTKTRDGKFLYGGNQGLLIIDPAQFRPWSYAPPIVATELRVNGERQTLSDLVLRGIKLSSEQRSFSLEFSALDYTSPSLNHYAFQLVGQDKDWIETDANLRVASYGNLWPGEYLLKIRGSNRNGVWSEQILEIPVEVLPAWWQTWWFYLACSLLAITAIIVLVHARTNYLRRKRNELEEKVLQRTNQLEVMTHALADKSRALEEASLADPLTGLRNRRFFDQHIQVDIENCFRAYDNSLINNTSIDDVKGLVFFLIDIDNFKQVNDIQGHAAGDAVLVEVSQRLREVFRENDYLIRWGGEEFLIITRSTAREDAHMLAERVRSKIVDDNFHLGDGVTLKKSCSIGFTCFPFIPQSPRALGWHEAVEIADVALYAAKRAGRNGWVGISATAHCKPEKILENIKHNIIGLIDKRELEIVSNLDNKAVMHAWVHATSTAHRDEIFRPV
ncbi:MAG: two-component regulator propeller domain-containing protein [Arenimonas sp.]